MFHRSQSASLQSLVQRRLNESSLFTIVFRASLLVRPPSSMLCKVLAQKGKNHDPQTQSPPRLTLLDAQKGGYWFTTFS